MLLLESLDLGGAEPLGNDVARLAAGDIGRLDRVELGLERAHVLPGNGGVTGGLLADAPRHDDARHVEPALPEHAEHPLGAELRHRVVGEDHVPPALRERPDEVAAFVEFENIRYSTINSYGQEPDPVAWKSSSSQRPPVAS